jgi:hypothetical protein
MALVAVAQRWCKAARVGGFIENPVGRLSTVWRKPDHWFHPADYAGYPGGAQDRYTKKTGLWTFGGAVMPAPRPLPVCADTGNRIHRASGWDKAEQKRIRCATPAGFAFAFYEANSR